MYKCFYTIILINLHIALQAQVLPNQMTTSEVQFIEDYKNSRGTSSYGITTPPGFEVRTMAEWEEIQSLVITWTGYTTILSQIVEHAQLECEVVIICNDSNSVISDLNSNGVNQTNVKFIERGFDSIWIRDYGANTVYQNDVDSLLLVDWIYNRPRYEDDAISQDVALFKNVPLYETTQAPYDLVHTGGNFMADGFGTAFSSNLVLDENGSNGSFNQTVKNEQQVDQIMMDFMGIETYIKMDVLPFDNIHHIDMHMKLIDEETLLVGEYPENVADGPYIEANLQYVLDNFNSTFGTPFKVIRIPMPDSPGGMYPDNGGYYRTYANNVFVNKTVLVPYYREEHDTTAYRILSEALPGYNIIGIDVDDPGSNLISASGAIHCITKAVGVDDPLLISHQELQNTTDTQNDYPVIAMVKHRTGVASVDLYYTTDIQNGFTNLPMTNIGADEWKADIPAQTAGKEVLYYVNASSNSGKTLNRPIVAPQGTWSFKVLGVVANINVDLSLENRLNVFPNPAHELICIPLILNEDNSGQLTIENALGEELNVIKSGQFLKGERKYFYDVSELSAGIYFIKFSSGNIALRKKLLVW